MTLLKDDELVKLVHNTNFIDGIKPQSYWYSTECPVQPASTDLHVGNIFTPEKSIHEMGSSKRPYKKYSLGPGETIVIETKETLNVPSNIAGIGFPQSRLSSKGILMTNPGHIDPGYSGSLSCTIINMSKEPHIFLEGESIFSILWFELRSGAHADWSVRNPIKSSEGTVSQQSLDLLTKDFIDIRRRVRKSAIQYTVFSAAIITGFSGIIAVTMTSYFNQDRSDIQSKMAEIENRMESIDLKGDLENLTDRLDNFETLFSNQILDSEEIPSENDTLDSL